MDGHGHMDASSTTFSYLCDGTPFSRTGSHRGGSWGGHVAAGVVLLVWALHWFFASSRQYLLSKKSAPYRSRTTYPLLPALPPSWPLEGLLKVLLSGLGILWEVLLERRTWSLSQCPAGTARAGHLFAEHLYNWQNVWVLLAFFVSGVADILSDKLQLPEGTDQAFIVVAFSMEALILSTGQQSEGSLDGMMYYLLFLLAVATAGFVVAELIWPNVYLLSAGKAGTMMLRGVWYIATARVLYEGRVAWQDQNPPDMGPAMFAPVLYVGWMHLVSLGLLAGYLVLRRVYGGPENEGGYSETDASYLDGANPFHNSIGGS